MAVAADWERGIATKHVSAMTMETLDGKPREVAEEARGRGRHSLGALHLARIGV